MKLEIDMEKIKTLIYLLECMEICFRETADREQDLISVLHDEHRHPDRDWTEQIKKMNEEIIRLYQKEIDMLACIDGNYSGVFTAIGREDVIAGGIPAVLSKLTEMERYREDWRQKESVYESMKIMQEAAEYTAKIKQGLEAYITPTEPIYTYRDIR